MGVCLVSESGRCPNLQLLPFGDMAGIGRSSKPGMPNTTMHMVNRPKPDQIAHPSVPPTAANLGLDAARRMTRPSSNLHISPPCLPSLPRPRAPRCHVRKHHEPQLPCHPLGSAAGVCASTRDTGQRRPTWQLLVATNRPGDFQRHSSFYQGLPKQATPLPQSSLLCFWEAVAGF